MIDLIGMIWLVVKVLMYVLLGIVLLYIMRDVMSYVNLSYYKKQGVKCFYWPCIGIGAQFIPDPKESDATTKLRRFVESVQNEPIIMFNNHTSTLSAGFLLDSSLIKEFMVKEGECSIRDEPMKGSNLGFFFEHSDYIFEVRGAYSKFFNYENLKKLTSSVSEIAERAIKQHKEEMMRGGSEKEKLVLVEFLSSLFSEIINRILFGEEQKHTHDGENLSTAIERSVNTWGGFLMNPINILTFGILYENGLFPNVSKYNKNLEKIEEKCWNIYLDRKKKGPRQNPNIIDLLIEFNEQRKKEGKPEMDRKEVAGNLIAMQFAGMDTSKTICTSAIVMMAEFQDHQEKLLQISSEIFGKNGIHKEVLEYSDLDHEILETYIKEFLRIANPFLLLNTRRLTKDCKIGKVSFRKGDKLMLPLQMMHTLSARWEDPFEFKPSRFDKEHAAKIDKTSYFPFGLGKRNCIGKTLGEMMVKIVILQFVKHFKIEKDPAFSGKKIIEFTYGYDHDASVLISLR